MLSLCLAVSLDGRLNTASKGQPTFTSREDRRRLFRLRAESDLVLVGANTVREEELPPLVRGEQFRALRPDDAPHPAVAIVSGSQRLPWRSRYFTERKQDFFLLTADPSPATREVCRELGVTIVELGQAGELAPALAELGRRGFERILAEGGGGLVHTLLREDLVDRLHLTIAPVVIAGESTPTMAQGPVLTGPPRFVLEECRPVEDELHAVYRRE